MYVYVYTFTHVYAYTGICTWAHINKLIHACMRVLWTWLYYLCSILAPHGIMTVGLRHMRPKPDKNNIALRHRCRRSHKQPHRHTGAQARRRTGAQAHRRTGAQAHSHSHIAMQRYICLAWTCHTYLNFYQWYLRQPSTRMVCYTYLFERDNGTLNRQHAHLDILYRYHHMCGRRSRHRRQEGGRARRSGSTGRV